MKTLHLFFSLLMLSLPAFLQAENIYILFEEQCMDRLEFEFNSSGDDYFVYHVNISATEKIVFDVGLESTTYQRFLPAQYISCAQARNILNKNIVSAINNRSDKVFLVKQESRDRYSVSPVLFAGYYKNDNNVVEYLSPKYQFRFNTRNAIFGEDVSLSRNAQVILDARLDNVCTGSFVLRRYARFESKPYTDIILVPEVGVVEERSGKRREDALNNAMTLDEINGDRLSTHLKRICNAPQTSIAGGDIFTPRNTSPYQPSYDYKPYQTNEVSGGVIIDPEPPTASSGPQATTSRPAHTVKSGETLWAISKKYGIDVSEIKDWNGLSSNVIHRGDRLYVSAPTSATALAAKSPDVVMSLPSNPTSVPAPYDQREEVFYDRSVPAWRKTTGTHTVTKGETIATIAVKYGYSEARFREINRLDPYEGVKPGQILLTDHCDDETVPVKSYSDSNTDFYTDKSRNIPVFYDRPEETVSRSNPFMPASYEASNDDIFIPKGYDYSRVQVNKNAKNRTVHEVVEGENLYRIALKYGVTVDYLRRINNMDSNEVLIPYQKIYID
jgi:LysM repeat protein